MFIFETASSETFVFVIQDDFVSTAKISSSLTEQSLKYSREMSIDHVYYYKVFRISVQKLGIYSVLGYSNIGLAGYIYETSFSPMFFYQNMISTTSGSDGQASFISRSKLSADKDYYLVVTTNYEETTGAFNLTITGPQTINIAAISGIHIYSYFQRFLTHSAHSKMLRHQTSRFPHH